ncbi:hypothetical protein PRIPAC_92263 [Pristionchus pacificus]|uniref:Uncharacterized protein n=1 Tax=Pristionchus pacificus TaxID=54126 RepID=A0A2A6CHD3_PRIPA|nr:hypothetical protein PRIPAC_92263 [Pristionchus pacificus]|eukprot:PDM77635.1 hypothetical protein PRIPAC_34502 [Pristionchus pacificus]
MKFIGIDWRRERNRARAERRLTEVCRENVHGARREKCAAAAKKSRADQRTSRFAWEEGGGEEAVTAPEIIPIRTQQYLLLHPSPASPPKPAMGERGVGVEEAEPPTDEVRSFDSRYMRITAESALIIR